MEMILYWMGVSVVGGFVFLSWKIRRLTADISRLMLFDRCNTDDLMSMRKEAGKGRLEMYRLDDSRQQLFIAAVTRLEGRIEREAEARRTADEKLTARVTRHVDA